IIENPADAFVEAFIGVERGRRALSLKQTPRGTVVVDSQGRTQGVLTDPASPLGSLSLSKGPSVGPEQGAHAPGGSGRREAASGGGVGMSLSKGPEQGAHAPGGSGRREAMSGGGVGMSLSTGPTPEADGRTSG